MDDQSHRRIAFYCDCIFGTTTGFEQISIIVIVYVYRKILVMYGYPVNGHLEPRE